MKAKAAILVFSLMGSALAGAGAAGFQKKYFAATRPGAWAKYVMTVGGKSESVTLYTRLPDDKGRQRLQVRTDFTSGTNQGTWSVSDYRLKTGYSLEDDALDYGRATEGLTMQAKGSQQVKMNASMLKAMVENMPDYSRSAVFVSTETVNGLACDRYKYTQKHPSSPVQIESGELWLNETVPFGLVRQRVVFDEATGKRLSDYEMNLQSSGADASSLSKTDTQKKSW